MSAWLVARDVSTSRARRELTYLKDDHISQGRDPFGTQAGEWVPYWTSEPRQARVFVDSSEAVAAALRHEGSIVIEVSMEGVVRLLPSGEPVILSGHP